MTMYEMNFSLLVEDTLKNIVLPEYRQIIVEVNKHPTSPQCTEREIKTHGVKLNQIMCV